MRRIPVLDFLRGIAVLLVMLFHFEITGITTRMGWAGVDLFFVLSGFLVSGLLFEEYKITGKIRPGYFLIRRGFKIYPLFYTVLVLHLIYFAIKGAPFTKGQLFAEIFFYQNYYPGFMGISWSLAIEEHFYFLLAFALFIAYKTNSIRSEKIISGVCIFICISCLVLRIYIYQNVPGYNFFVNYTPTHLRIDALSFGVLLSYWFCFSRETFLFFFRKYLWILLPLALVFILPVFIWERETFLVNTFGHTFLYLGFGIITSLAITFAEKINQAVNRSFWRFLFNFIVWIGFYSYAIYLLHFKAGPIISNWVRHHQPFVLPEIIYLVVYLGANIVAGVLLSKAIERPFLRLREKYFPAKSRPGNYQAVKPK